MREFKPFVFYNKVGDQLEVKWSEVAPVAEWINPSLTLLRDPEDEKKVIGVEIMGFRQCFVHGGIRIDPDYDESSPLTKEEEEELDSKLKELGFQVSETDVGD